MAEFVYNNTKNANTGYLSFKLNYKYYFYIFYKKDLNFYLKLKIAKKLSFKLENLMANCQKNLYQVQNFQK